MASYATLVHFKSLLEANAEPARIALTAMKRYQDITGRGNAIDNPVTKEDCQSELFRQVVDGVVAESKSDQLTMDLEGLRWGLTRWEIYRLQRIPSQTPHSYGAMQ